jgi:hypothetical protein
MAEYTIKMPEGMEDLVVHDSPANIEQVRAVATAIRARKKPERADGSANKRFAKDGTETPLEMNPGPAIGIVGPDGEESLPGEPELQPPD